MATALVLSGITIAGCGGDDSTIQSVSTTSTTSTAAVSTEEFITAADARCAEANSAIANLSTDAAPRPRRPSSSNSTSPSRR